MSEKETSEDVCYEESKNGVYLKVKVVPKSSRNEVVGIVGGRIKITVRAVPQEGKANAMLEQIVADFFDVKKSDCTVTAGKKASRKTIFVMAGVVTIVNKLNATFYGKKH
ncbi:MAG: DUF167 domain-containing protein [Holosporaceae bacterium]|jgi:uncharacterized protein (TIGR00251 family)|nr:DUF167 domain-containing protein [Holosporaceae bacterium]